MARTEMPSASTSASRSFTRLVPRTYNQKIRSNSPAISTNSNLFCAVSAYNLASSIGE